MYHPYIVGATVIYGLINTTSLYILPVFINAFIAATAAAAHMQADYGPSVVAKFASQERRVIGELGNHIADAIRNKRQMRSRLNGAYESSRTYRTGTSDSDPNGHRESYDSTSGIVLLLTIITTPLLLLHDDDVWHFFIFTSCCSCIYT